MSRAGRNKLPPWIESLILNYGSPDGSSSTSRRLKAHVIGVGEMTQSEAQGCDGPSGLLFLSDGVIQIPAVLTSSAWDLLQDKEERESFTSLLNTTVFIKDYQLQFYMSPEQTKCRFFLSVGELATTVAGPVKDTTPCCTTLTSVRQKICETWRALVGQESQDTHSQCEFNLTELLGEWQHDNLQTVLEDIRERLMAAKSHPTNPQPSTSTYTPSLTHQNTFTATGWDIDRVRFQREKCFTVPINCLVIPVDHTQQLQTPLDVESITPSELSAPPVDKARDLPQVHEVVESVDDADWRMEDPALVQVDCFTHENFQYHVSESVQDETMITRLNEGEIKPLSSPWDIFPAPEDTSLSTDASPEAVQPAFASTQLPVQSSRESQQTSVKGSNGEQSDLVPYQNPPNSTGLTITVSTSASASVSPPQQFTKQLSLPRTTNRLSSETEGMNLEHKSLVFEEDIETVERKARTAKMRRSKPSVEALTISEEEEKEEAQISGSPPSWLFDSENSGEPEEGSSHQQGQTKETALRTTPTVHSDGKPFSYSYQVCGKSLNGLSQFKISDSLLNWAVKYLLTPKQTENSHCKSTTCD